MTQVTYVKIRRSPVDTNKIPIVLLSILAALVLAVNSVAGTLPAGAAPTRINNKKTKSFAEARDEITRQILVIEREEFRILGDSSGSPLRSWAPNAVKAEVESCRKALVRLASFQNLSPAEKIDREVLSSHLKYLEYYYGQYHGERGNLQISAYPYELIQFVLKRAETSASDHAAVRDLYASVEGILKALPEYLKQQQWNLREGLKLRKPDKAILEGLIGRIGAPNDPESIRADLKVLEESIGSAELRSVLSTATVDSIRRLIKPADTAYSSHLEFLKSELRPHAAESWRMGSEEYRRRFILMYGKRIALDDIVRDAESELGRLKAEMTSLAGELRPGLSLQEALIDLRKQHFGSETELLEAYRNLQNRIDDKLTRKIGLPVNAAAYVPAPAGMPVGLATNLPAPLLTSGKGIVLVDVSQAGLVRNAIIDLAWLTGHEGNPGHASQSIFFQNAYRTGKAPLCRFLNVPDQVGSVRGNWSSMLNIEGWAFYTERLLLDSDILSREERLGSLTAQALRAARVVVDVRMHTENWSRADVTKYLVENAGTPVQIAEGQAFRYSVIPLQALSYYLGARQFENLQKKYGKRYGSRFYEEMLSLGPIPPGLIDEYFESISKIQ